MVYLDNNATTPVADEVRAAMQDALSADFANPSSPYTPARRVSAALRKAREQVAALIGAEPDEVLFTSGGTESNNTVLNTMLGPGAQRRHVVTTAVEHPSVLRSCDHLATFGHRVSRLAVDAKGALSAQKLAEACADGGADLASVMSANNETGILFPVAVVADAVRARGGLLHVDAVQSAGKMAIDVNDPPVDYLSLSSHKMHGPKGIGALFVRRGVPVTPYMHGGEQELGRRAGTENVPGIVGFGAAAELVQRHLKEAQAQMRGLRDRLERELTARMSGFRVVGAESPRLPNTVLLLLDKIEAESVLALLDMEGICCSSGSACAAGSTEPSHVLQAMGMTREEARGAVRLSLSRYNTGQDVETVVEALPRIVAKLRRPS